jgi:hypothetical protein
LLGAALVSLFALVPTWQFGAALALSLALSLSFVPVWYDVVFLMGVDVWVLGVGLQRKLSVD